MSTCLGVSRPPPQLQRPESIPGTRALCRKRAKPVQPVRNCTRAELSAFRRPECSFRTLGSGGISTQFQVSGLAVACHLRDQAFSTLFLSVKVWIRPWKRQNLQPVENSNKSVIVLEVEAVKTDVVRSIDVLEAGKQFGSASLVYTQLGFDQSKRVDYCSR
jgi:hypothetical protein